MRLSRRTALLAGIGAVLGGAGLLGRTRTGPGEDGPADIAVEARPIAQFHRADPGRRRFGALAFRSGLDLRSGHRWFGGFSGLWRSPEGGRIVAVSDRARWLAARLVLDRGRLAGLAEARMAPILGREGPLRRGRSYDVEALAIRDGVAFVGIERVHAVLRFDWAGAGMAGRGEPLLLPPEAEALPHNKGLEALALAPPDGPLAGGLVAVAERARWGDDAATRGFILTGPLAGGAFDVPRSEGYDITDLAFLDGGEALLLERRYALVGGPAVRIRRLGRDAIRPGARADGPVIFEADAAHEIDNMEGLAVHRAAEGGVVVTLISDDNFSPLQRTLLLDFALEA